jgi:asparagine synthetase B (glutamine-hydrolysing)
VKRRPDELLAECRHLLDQAVTDRIGDAGDVLAAHLSAGLDSSTAAALAARHKPAGTRLLALTAVPALQDFDSRGRLVDEGPLAARVAASLSDVEHRSVPAQGNPVAAMRSAAETFDQPLPNPHNHMWVRAINDEAARAGARILLIGQIGNYSFSMSGDPYRRLKDVAKRLMRRGGTSRRADPFVRDESHAPQEAIPASGAERRLHFLQRIDPGSFIAGVEDHWSLSTRDPFADRRVMEFSLGISEATLASFGDRGLARAVAAELLPRGFVANRQRGYQSADWIEQLRRHRVALHDLVEEARNHDLAAELVDLQACEAAIARLEQLSTPSPLDEQVYRIDLPRALAVIAFIAALASVPSQEPRMARANILR